MEARGTCFVISPIGPDGSDIRRRSDTVLKHLITPVAEESGYVPLRADKISETGLITTQVINHLIDDPMVIADLTGENANVFYELAVRHAAHKPYIQLIEKGQRIPFDVAGIRTIEIDLKDLDSVADARAAIKAQMMADVTKVESPISNAIDFDRLRRSDDPEKRELADIKQGLSEVGSLVRELVAHHNNQSRGISSPTSSNSSFTSFGPPLGAGIGAGNRSSTSLGGDLFTMKAVGMSPMTVAPPPFPKPREPDSNES